MFEDSGEKNKVRMRRGRRLLEFAWVLIGGLVFGVAGIRLMFTSSELSDAFLGLFLVALMGAAMYWAYKRYKNSNIE